MIFLTIKNYFIQLQNELVSKIFNSLVREIAEKSQVWGQAFDYSGIYRHLKKES